MHKIYKWDYINRSIFFFSCLENRGATLMASYFVAASLNLYNGVKPARDFIKFSVNEPEEGANLGVYICFR